jgi:hypothetical protein
MPVLTEEVFGPAVPIIGAANADDAIRLANDTPFGLRSNVWTSDLARGEALAVRLDAGHTAVNGMTSSDPRLPFGGVKESGYGRELSSQVIHEFVNVHTVVVESAAGPSGKPPDNDRVSAGGRTADPSARRRTQAPRQTARVTTAARAVVKLRFRSPGDHERFG